jgi:hypothetical protein
LARLRSTSTVGQRPGPSRQPLPQDQRVVTQPQRIFEQSRAVRIDDGRIEPMLARMRHPLGARDVAGQDWREARHQMCVMPSGMS